MAYLYGLMYLVLSTFPILWEKDYHMSIGIGGLNYLSLGLGFFLGVQICAPLSDKVSPTHSISAPNIIQLILQDIHPPKNTQQWKRQTRVPCAIDVRRCSSCPHRSLLVWLERAAPPPLDHAEHRRLHILRRLDHRTPGYTDIHRGLVHALCCERDCRGGRIAEFGGLWVPALRALYVSTVGLWLGE